MRAQLLVLFALSLPISVLAQEPRPDRQSEVLQIENYAWGALERTVTKEDPNFKANSNGRPLNTKDNPINSVGNPINMVGVPMSTAPVRPQGAPPDPHNTLGNGEAVDDVQVRRETYVLVKNVSDRVIKKVSWDFIFYKDEEMKTEAKHFKYRTSKKILPGQLKFLSELVDRPAPSKFRKVSITRVEFEDGTIWEPAI
jgi:hypothetical protein